MIKKTFLSAFLVFSMIALCLAATIDGTWVGTMTTPDGQGFPIAYHFKADGDKLTGTIDIPDSELTIEDGKINGKNFTFNVNYNGEGYLHEGEFMEDSIKVKVHFGDQVMENVLKRESK